MVTRRSLLRTAAAIPLLAKSPFATAQANNVVLYTSNGADATESALAVIGKKSPQLRIQVVAGGTGVLMRRIAAEKENPGGDVFWSGGFGTLGNYTDYFERYASPELANIAAEFRGPENLWTGTNVHPIAVMINTSRLGGRAAPKTWSDLLGSQWRGQVAITDPANSSLSYIQIYGVLQLLGLDGLKQLARNAVIVGTTGQVHAGVGNGEFPVGLTSESSAYEYIAGGQSNIAIVYPSDGTFLSPEGMVIIKNAKNKPAALALYNAFLSKEVQEELLRKVFRRPSRPDVKVSEIVKLPELSSIKVFPLDQQKAAEQITSVIKVWKEAVAAAKG